MFKVNRLSTEVVAPAKPTPHEFKSLSDLDNCFKYQFPSLLIYPHNPCMNGVDLVKLIRNAISQALVHYYPLAGRLREDPSGKAIVECTGEGVLFIEADVDITLDYFGYPFVPPFMCSDQLLFDVPGSSDILNCPLILIQMTRLKCGGLIIGVRLNHCMSDGFGLAQFMDAVAEMAKGATFPSVLPTWERHIFNSKNLQQLNSSVSKNNNNYSFDSNDLCRQTFFFGPMEISALRKNIPHKLQRYSSFEILVACVWKCRVLALAPHPEEIMSLVWPINLRKKSRHSMVPSGYYGNALTFSVVKSTAKEITENPLSHTMRLVTNGKEIVTEDTYQFVMSSRTSKNNYMVSDLTMVGLEEIDFGWGKPAYSGPILYPPFAGFHLPFKHKKWRKWGNGANLFAN